MQQMGLFVRMTHFLSMRAHNGTAVHCLESACNSIR